MMILVWLCKRGKKKKNKNFDIFILQKICSHGFWAQSRNAKNLRQQPRNCRNEKQLPLITVNTIFSIKFLLRLHMF